MRPQNGSAEDYPYNPQASTEGLLGLDKLRAVRDRQLAAVLYELYWSAEDAERSGATRRWREEAERDAAAELRDLRLTMVEKALLCDYGVGARQLAEQLLVDRTTRGDTRVRTDDRSLEVFEGELRHLRQRSGRLERIVEAANNAYRDPDKRRRQ